MQLSWVLLGHGPQPKQAAQIVPKKLGVATTLGNPKWPQKWLAPEGIDYHRAVSDDEDVRITERGQVLVARRELIERLKTLTGSFRLVESSRDLLWLKRIDIDGDNAFTMRMAGEIAGKLTVMEVLSMLASANWNGELHVIGTDSQRTLYIHQGVLKSAGSDLPSERLGEVMLSRGAITHEQLVECVSEMDASRRFGEMVVDRGLVDREQLFSHVRAQMQVIFNGALLVREGFYSFVHFAKDAAPPSVTVHLPIQHLLMEGVQRIDEMELFRERIPSSDLCPEATDQADASKLDEHLLPMAGMIDGQRSIADIARELGWDEFLATKAVYQLLQSGYARLGRARRLDRDAAAHAIQQFNNVMRDIFVAVAKHGSLDNTRNNLNAWIHGSGYANFFGDEVELDGSINVERVLSTLEQVDPGHALDGLHQALHEVAAFALFAATPTLPREAELNLARDVNQRLRAIKP